MAFILPHPTHYAVLDIGKIDSVRAPYKVLSRISSYLFLSPRKDTSAWNTIYDL